MSSERIPMEPELEDDFAADYKYGFSMPEKSLLKAEKGLAATDSSREQEQIERLRSLAAAAKLDPAFSEKFLRFIIDEVIRHHQRSRA